MTVILEPFFLKMVAQDVQNYSYCVDVSVGANGKKRELYNTQENLAIKTITGKIIDDICSLENNISVDHIELTNYEVIIVYTSKVREYLYIVDEKNSSSILLEEMERLAKFVDNVNSSKASK